MQEETFCLDMLKKGYKYFTYNVINGHESFPSDIIIGECHKMPLVINDDII